MDAAGQAFGIPDSSHEQHEPDHPQIASRTRLATVDLRGADGQEEEDEWQKQTRPAHWPASRSDSPT
jgi:hypothetical protein